MPLTGTVFATDPLGNNAYIAAVLAELIPVTFATEQKSNEIVPPQEREKLKLGSGKLTEGKVHNDVGAGLILVRGELVLCRDNDRSGVRQLEQGGSLCLPAGSPSTALLQAFVHIRLHRTAYH